MVENLFVYSFSWTDYSNCRTLAWEKNPPANWRTFWRSKIFVYESQQLSDCQVNVSLAENAQFLFA